MAEREQRRDRGGDRRREQREERLEDPGDVLTGDRSAEAERPEGADGVAAAEVLLERAAVAGERQVLEAAGLRE